MSQEQILVAIVSGVTATIVMAGYLIGHRIVMNRRMAALASLSMEEPTLESALPLPAAKDWSERVDRRFANLVHNSGLEASVEQVIGLILMCCVGSGAGFYLWRSELWLGLFGFVLGLALSFGYLLVRAGRRRWQMHQQMPDALYLLSRSLRAGMGLEHSFHLVSQESPQPLGDELRRVSEQVKLGLAVPAALQSASDRVGLLDFSVFAAMLSIHRNTGGQLPLLLDRLAGGIRDRVQYQGQFRAATAMGRVSAIALGAAVPCIFLWYILFQPETVQMFVQTPGGLAMLGVAGMLEIVGVLWLYRILKTDM